MFTNLYSLVFAQIPDVPLDGMGGDDPVGFLFTSVKWVFTQFHSHNSGPAVGMILMLMVYVFNKVVEDHLDPKYIPWCSAILGMITSVGMNLMAMKVGVSPKAWFEAIAHGLVLGSSAVGFYHLVGHAALPRVHAFMSRHLARFKRHKEVVVQQEKKAIEVQDTKPPLTAP